MGELLTETLRGLSPMVVMLAVAAVFGAAFLRGFTGFGFALAAVPALSLMLNPIVVVPCTLILGAPRRHPGSPQASPSRPLALGLDPRRGLACGKSHRDLGAGDSARQCHACGHRHRADGSRRGALAPAAPLQFAAHGTRSRNRDRIGRAEREHSSGGPASHSLFLELG